MKTNFYKNLTRLRLLRGYTQAQMAEKIGVSRSTYTNYETGNRTPDYEILERISDMLACSLDELFGRKVRKIHLKPAEGPASTYRQ